MEDNSNLKTSGPTLNLGPTNVNSSEIDEETQNKLKGDAIGDTMYSQQFVIKTLMNLKEIKWNENLEEDLCFLWDSTLEKDVADFLFSLNYPEIMCEVLLNNDSTEYSRLFEIIIGILGNILLVCKNGAKISENQTKIVLEQLKTSDSFILIQCARFLSTVGYLQNDLSFIEKDTVDILSFILENSANTDLLLKTLEAVSKITQDEKLNLSLVSTNLVLNSLVATETFLNAENSEEFELNSENSRLAVKFFIEIVVNFCVYINNTENNNLFDGIVKNSESFLCFAYKIVNFYANPENLLPLTNEIIFYFSGLNFIFRVLKVGLVENLFVETFKIVSILVENDYKEDVSDFFEMFCFFIHISNKENIKKSLTNTKKLGKVIDFVLKENFKFHFEYRDKIIILNG